LVYPSEAVELAYFSARFDELESWTEKIVSDVRAGYVVDKAIAVRALATGSHAEMANLLDRDLGIEDPLACCYMRSRATWFARLGNVEMARSILERADLVAPFCRCLRQQAAEAELSR
jgi:hypothetical protein